MNIFKCLSCKKQSKENKIILTVNSEGEWVLHCPKCNSDMLSLTYEIQTQSPHSLKTYHELEEDSDNDN